MACVQHAEQHAVRPCGAGAVINMHTIIANSLNDLVLSNNTCSYLHQWITRLHHELLHIGSRSCVRCTKVWWTQWAGIKQITMPLQLNYLFRRIFAPQGTQYCDRHKVFVPTQGPASHRRCTCQPSVALLRPAAATRGMRIASPHFSGRMAAAAPTARRRVEGVHSPGRLPGRNSRWAQSYVSPCRIPSPSHKALISYDYGRTACYDRKGARDAPVNHIQIDFAIHSVHNAPGTV